MSFYSHLLQPFLSVTLSMLSIVRLTDSSANMVFDLLKQLLDRDLVSYYDNGKTWIRNIINSQDGTSHGERIAPQILASNVNGE